VGSAELTGSFRYFCKYYCILVEVLSKSSATYDRDFKLRNYKNIPSLQYYMLVSQYEYYVELYTRTDQKDIWTYQSFEGPDAVIHFDRLDFTMPLASIYENIVFVAEEEGIK
jgi:Uma2 family endonuclease